MREVATASHGDLDLVACSWAGGDREELLGDLAAWLTANGYTTDGFADALLERERSYPTGLPTAGGGVAIPHADPRFARRAALVACRPAGPVGFRRMDDPSVTVDAELVVVLVLGDASRHMELLGGLAGVLGDGDRVRALTGAAGPAALLEVMAVQLVPGAS
jgi:PTS system galactitol-specific IIA component